jgi:PAS domain S-box-containing protein
MLSGRGKTLLVLVLAPLAIYLGLLNLNERLEWKQPFDGIKLEQTEDGAEVTAILVPASHSLGIRPGDLLVDINGLSIRALDDYTEVVEVLGESGHSGVVADYTFRRAGSAEEVTYPVKIELVSQLSGHDLPLIMVAFVYLGIGIFIFLRNWQAPGAFHFSLICLTSFIVLLFRHSGRASPFDITVYWCDAVALLILPPMFLHFCSYFPAPMAWIRKKPYLKMVFYAPALLLICVRLAWFLGKLQPIGLARTEDVSRFLDKVELAHFLALFGAGAWVLLKAKNLAATSERRKQMKWITVGTFVGILPFAALYGIPYLLDVPLRTWMFASVLSLGMIPLSFGYAITKYRLMDVDLLFKKGVAYVLASSTLLAFYVGIALLMARAIQGLSSQSGFLLLAVSALAVSFLFAPLRDKIQEQLDRRFYRERYSYRRSFLEFGQTLGSEISLERLSDRIANRLQKTLDVSPVTIFLKDDSRPNRFRLGTHRGLPDNLDQAEVELSEDVLFEMAPAAGFTRLDPTRDEVRSLKAELEQLSIHYVEPLRIRARVIGFLGLGERSNGDLLTSEDREMVSTLAGYAAIAIDNALLYRSLEVKANELSQLKIYNENVIENINLGVSVISPDGEVTVWNSAMTALTQIEHSDAQGKDIAELLPENLIQAMREISDGPGWLVEAVSRLYKIHVDLGNDQVRLFNVTVSPFVSREHLNTGTLLIFDDITEKIRLEGQLQQAEKLSSIGLFAAGLAHEVNTPLTGISSYTQMLLSETPADDPRKELLQKVEMQSFRASEIVNNLLNFARFSPSEFQEINLNSLMMDTLSLLQHQFRRNNIEVSMELEPSLPMTVGNGGKLQQVFMNLFLNAKDAMPQGGRLTLKTRTSSSELIVEVADNGVGISKEEIKRIYDPFFTTKSVGKGTGLGLSVSYGIIQEHSGRVTVDSLLGEGTTFSLYFPIRRVN